MTFRDAVQKCTLRCIVYHPVFSSLQSHSYTSWQSQVADVSYLRLSCRETRTRSPNGPFGGCWLAYPMSPVGCVVCVQPRLLLLLLRGVHFPLLMVLQYQTFWWSLSNCCLCQWMPHQPREKRPNETHIKRERRPWWWRWRSAVYSLHTYHVCAAEAVGLRPWHIKTGLAHIHIISAMRMA